MYDSAEQIAVAWVQIPPTSTDAAARSLWMYYGNRNAPPAATARGTCDASDTAVFHFAEKEGLPRDVTSYATQVASFTGSLGATGIVDGGARFTPSQGLVLAATPQLDMVPAKGFTASFWLKLDDAGASGLVFSRAQDKTALEIGLARGRLYAQVTAGKNRSRAEAAEPFAAAQWQHVAIAWSDRLSVYVGGEPAVTLAVPAMAIGGGPTIGAHATLGPGFAGEIDELQLAGVARPAAWIAAASLAALFRGGVEEFRRQRETVAGTGGTALAPANLEVIKASIDTSFVNESQRMNRSMVLLTLAVSAAPFLGLLGTVVGIMITFGAIALAGDVNVNTIAPGVAAALATTVAGLIVAIPVIFGYNYLATKIRGLNMAMEVFANELVGRLAAVRIAA